MVAFIAGRTAPEGSAWAMRRHHLGRHGHGGGKVAALGRQVSAWPPTEIPTLLRDAGPATWSTAVAPRVRSQRLDP
jgi:hypothetical protein